MNNSTGLTIKEVNHKNTRVLNDFIGLPYRLYKDDPYWVAPMVSEEKKRFSPKYHPFLQRNEVEYFVCYRDAEPVGRIAGIINKDHNRHHSDKTAFFGFFESIEDDAVAARLLSAAGNWVKDRGADALRGPTNFDINDMSGLLTRGFDEIPYIMMTYNFPYYQPLLQRNGFEMAMRFFAYSVTQEAIRFPDVLERLQQRQQDNGITLRSADFSFARREAQNAAEIFNRSWINNWGFVPFTEEELLRAFEQVKFFAKEDLIIFAEYKGRPVGFALALPDINQLLHPMNGRLLPFNWAKLMVGFRKINRIRVLLMGVVPEFRSKGIDLMFYKRLLENSRKHGYHKAELSWILESNTMMNRVLEHINAVKSKEYGMFEKKLSKP